jgi:hypothetical protein
VENVDYRLTQIGPETRIERLASGNIADGETVLIDYEYELNGSYEYREILQSLNLLYTLDRRYDFSLGYYLDDPKLQSGVPIRSLVKRERYMLGVDARIPINRISEYGWGLHFERRKDNQSPYTRGYIDLSYSVRLPLYSSIMNLNAEYEEVDNELTTNDVKEGRLRATLNIRPTWRSAASLEFLYRRDNGGVELKEYADAALNYAWSRGKLGFVMKSKYTKELQGDTTRSQKSFSATLTRKFR